VRSFRELFDEVEWWQSMSPQRRRLLDITELYLNRRVSGEHRSHDTHDPQTRFHGHHPDHGTYAAETPRLKGSRLEGSMRVQRNDCLPLEIS
jgi:hypothetical protein